MTPDALARLRLHELAVSGAEQLHEDDALFEEGRGGHVGDFSTCPHPDCLLVRTDLASAASRPMPDVQTFRYSRDSDGFALCHHGRRIACEECVAEEEGDR